jgi:hypothetical protein
MYRKAEFFKMDFPLPIEEIKAKFSKLKSLPRKTEDKNSIIRKITLDCSFEHKKEKDENYLVGIDFQFQISPRRGVPYQKTRDLYGLIFLPKNNLLVILGRDDAVGEIITFIAEILYPESKRHLVFRHVQFTPESLVNTIKKLRDDDDESWCDEYRGKHGATKYQGKKTKSNFSLGEGSCILDDSEAIDAISQSTSINPTYKFYKCPKLNTKTYDSPKTLLFNGGNGSVSVTVSQDFDNWYKFISEFLVKELTW